MVQQLVSPFAGLRTPEKIAIRLRETCRSISSFAGVHAYDNRTAPGAKLRVDNLHYDLTEDDLEVRFRRY